MYRLYKLYHYYIYKKTAAFCAKKANADSRCSSSSTISLQVFQFFKCGV